MARKRVSKSTVDKQQSKDIAMLKRMLPTQKEVVENNYTGLPLNTGEITRLTPTALDTEKILVRGIDLRLNNAISSSGTDTEPGRYMVFVYKCDVDNSSATPAVVLPSVSDVIDINHGINALINPDNASRIRVLYDTTLNLMPPNQYRAFRSFKKFFKNPIKCLSPVDKAFVHRVLMLHYTSAASVTTAAAYSCNIHTLQLP